MTATARGILLVVAVVVLAVVAFVVLRSRIVNADCKAVLKQVLIRWVETTGRPAQTITEKDIRNYIQQRVQATGVAGDSQQKVSQQNSVVIREKDKTKIQQYIADIEATFHSQSENSKPNQIVDDWFMFLRFAATSENLPFELSQVEESCLEKIKFSKQLILELPR
jgi:hypothetical protein